MDSEETRPCAPLETTTQILGACRGIRDMHPLEPSCPLTSDDSEKIRILSCEAAARSRENPEAQDTAEAIELLRGFLQLPPPSYTASCPATPHNQLLFLLSVLLERSYRRHNSLQILGTGSDLCIEALQSSSPGTAFRDDVFKHLEKIGQLRFVYLQDPVRCQKALQYYRAIVNSRPPGDSLRSSALGNLASALWIQTCWHGKGEDIKESIELSREVLKLRPPNHPLRNGALNNLALALEYSSEISGERDHTVEAVRIYREILGTQPEEIMSRIGTLNNLAHALVAQVEWYGGMDVLSEAIEVYQKAIELCPKDHMFRDIPRKGLGAALFSKYKSYNGSVDELAKVIELNREALAIEPPGHPRRTTTLIYLGRGLYNLGERNRDLSLLDEGVTHLREALTAENITQPGQGMAFLMLAAALYARFDLAPDPHIIAEALECHYRVLELHPAGHPFRADSHHSIARILLRTAPLNSWRVALDHVAAANKDALFTPRQRLKLTTETVPSIEDAIQHYPREEEEWVLEALEVYTHAIELIPRVAHLGLDVSARLHELTGTEELCRTASMRALLLDRVPIAIEVLEEGRTVFWAQSLHLSVNVLDNLPEPVQGSFKGLWGKLEQGSIVIANAKEKGARLDRVMEEQRKLNAQIQDMLDEIRSRPGFERYMKIESFERLTGCASHSKVIVLIATQVACFAVTLLDAVGSYKTTRLHRVTLQGLRSLCVSVQNSGLRVVKSEGRDELWHERKLIKTQPTAVPNVDEVLRTIWQMIVEPIFNDLNLEVRMCMSFMRKILQR